MTVRILTATIVLAACLAGPAAAQTPQMVGGDADAHGCLPSTGATWSTLRKACVQPWEAGVKLMPPKPQGTATYAAYVVFASGHDGRRAEVYLYDHKGSLILEKAGWGGHKWTGEGFVLTRDNGVYTLDGPDGQLLYRSPAG